MKTPNTSKPALSAPNSRNFSNMSTSSEAQYVRTLQMLRTGQKNTMELRRAGVMMPAARIKELNDKFDYSIVRVAQITLWDEWGYAHKGVAVYELVSEPPTVGVFQ
jgi:Helix-turn-helix domain